MLHDLSHMNQVEAHAFIVSLMLFPDDEDKRRRAYYYYSINSAANGTFIDSSENGQEHFNIFGKFISNLSKQSGTEIFINTLFNGSTAISSEIKRRTLSGIFTGHIYNYIIKNKTTLAYAARRTSSALAQYQRTGKLSSYSVTYKNIRDNIWPQFQPVSHLWAASTIICNLNIMSGHSRDEIDLIDSPSLEEMGSPGGLGGFLCLAGVLLDLGASLRTNRRGPATTFVNPNSVHSFRLPWGVEFKPTNLR